MRCAPRASAPVRCSSTTASSGCSTSRCRATTTSWTPAPPTSPPWPGSAPTPRRCSPAWPASVVPAAASRCAVRSTASPSSTTTPTTRPRSRPSWAPPPTIVRRAGHGSLRVVFQPHLYSRTRDFATEFAAALAPADQVVVLDVYGAREQPVEGITSALVGDPLRALPGQRTVLVGPTRDEAVAVLAAAARPGDLVLTVGSRRRHRPRAARRRRAARPHRRGDTDEPRHHTTPRRRPRGLVLGEPLPRAGAVEPPPPLAPGAAPRARGRDGGPARVGRRLEHLARGRRGRGHRRHRRGGRRPSPGSSTCRSAPRWPASTPRPSAPGCASG